MADIAHEFAHHFSTAAGEDYRVRVLTEQRGNVWIGWLEFSSEKGGPTKRTSQETSQPNREAVIYWASGLELVYLEGAFNRAR